VERLLITGIDHPLGANLALTLSDHCDVLGVYSQHAVESPGLRTEQWAAGDRAAIETLIQDWQPQWIVHCGPLSVASWDPAPRVTRLEQEPQVVAHLAQLAAQQACRLTVLSSDVVFAGPRMFHEENSPAASPSPRATHVRNMERALEPTGALVARTHAYGWGPVAATSCFAEQVFEALTSRTPVTADGRRHATPILATDLALLLLRAYELRLHGLYHMAGAERTSPFRFVSELAAALGLPGPSGCPEPIPTTPPAWHEETSLNNKRARRLLEMATPMLRDGLHRFAEQAHNGWRDRWQVAGAIAGRHEIAA
jgi:dTDP-4-dehydrorhamnose reductase